MTRRRYILTYDARIMVRTDRLPLVQGWLADGDPRYAACDTLACFDTPCAYCIAAGAPLDDAHDAPLVPVREYLGELEDFEVAMRENGAWDGLDTFDPTAGSCAWDAALSRVVHDDEDCPLLFLPVWRGTRMAIG